MNLLKLMVRWEIKNVILLIVTMFMDCGHTLNDIITNFIYIIHEFIKLLLLQTYLGKVNNLSRRMEDQQSLVHEHSTTNYIC
jgi:hypothetical protein